MFLVSITKALRDKFNYANFPRSVYVFVGVFQDLFLGRNEVPIRENSLINEFEIDSLNTFQYIVS